MAAKIPIRLTLFFCGAFLLTLAGLVSLARRDSVEAYYLEYLQPDGGGGVETCRQFYYHRPEECGYLDTAAYTVPSPDGRWRAVDSPDAPGEWTIYPAGSRHIWATAPKVTVQIEGGYVPVWSPDGRWLALTRPAIAHQLDLYRFELATGELVLLTGRSGDELAPGWSPDGQRIAYEARDLSGISRILIMNADGSEQQQPAPGIQSAYNPQWSPDGEWLLFQSLCSQMPCDGQDFDLYRLRLADGHIEQVVARRGHEYTAVWSPDGAWIAYVFQEDNVISPQIFRVRPDGSDVQALANNPRTVFYAPTWVRTPDKQWHPVLFLTTAFVMMGVVWRLKSRFD